MQMRINCKMNHQGAFCKDHRVRRSLFGIGARLCLVAEDKPCSYIDGYPRPPAPKGIIGHSPIGKPINIILSLLFLCLLLSGCRGIASGYLDRRAQKQRKEYIEHSTPEEQATTKFKILDWFADPDNAILVGLIISLISGKALHTKVKKRKDVEIKAKAKTKAKDKRSKLYQSVVDSLDDLAVKPGEKCTHASTKDILPPIDDHPATLMPISEETMKKEFGGEA